MLAIRKKTLSYAQLFILTLLLIALVKTKNLYDPKQQSLYEGEEASSDSQLELLQVNSKITSGSTQTTTISILPHFGYFFGLYITQCVATGTNIAIDTSIEGTAFYTTLVTTVPTACTIRDYVRTSDNVLLKVVNWLSDLQAATYFFTKFGPAQELATSINTFISTAVSKLQPISSKIHTFRTSISDPTLGNLCDGGKAFLLAYAKSKEVLYKNYFPNTCSCIKNEVTAIHTVVYTAINGVGYGAIPTINIFTLDFPAMPTLENFLSGVMKLVNVFMDILDMKIDIIPGIYSVSIRDILTDISSLMGSITDLLQGIINTISIPITNLLSRISDIINAITFDLNLNLSYNINIFNLNFSWALNILPCAFGSPFIPYP